jgi:hypothetical protein
MNSTTVSVQSSPLPIRFQFLASISSSHVRVGLLSPVRTYGSSWYIMHHFHKFPDLPVPGGLLRMPL